ncbi:MAG TPA: DNA mismatch repair protein MutS [Polyangia bacterium]
MASDPLGEHRAQLAARQAEVAALTRRDRALSTARLIAFVAIGAAVWLAYGPRLFPPGLIALPAAIFFALVILHDRTLRARRRAERAATFYERGIARIEDRWRGTGVFGERFDDPKHPYARDLDLFGSGSLFELLCTARTSGGEERLADWLRAPAAPEVVRARQAAISELRDRLALREELALAGDDVRAEVDPRTLTEWGLAPPALAHFWMRPILALLALAAIATTVGWLAFDTGWAPLVVVLALEWAAMRFLRDGTDAVTGAIGRRDQHLALLGRLLERFEREPFESPLLVALKAKISEGGVPASRRIDELVRLAALLLQMQNQFFAPFGWVLCWSPQLAFAVERWRRHSGRAIPGWLDAGSELEALIALAGYAFEHPRDPFPEIVDEAPRFDGEGLGHPLLPESRCVRNDVRLDASERLLLVSGSNMSGKSTLLRTVGVNAVLALAGAPVRATRLQLSPLQLGATLRVQDSLAEGASRFYAEILRLRQLVELAAGRPPLLFLLDEILHGTNSHDRRLGAEAVVRGLLERGAIGLCTTHDLALAALGDSLPGAVNVHFEDELVSGELRFDYRMRPGVVRRSNALELMRAVGLEV